MAGREVVQRLSRWLTIWTGPVLHFCQVSSKYSKGYSSYRADEISISTRQSAQWGTYTPDQSYCHFLKSTKNSKCPKILNTLKFRTPKIFAQNNFWKCPKILNSSSFAKRGFLKFRTHLFSSNFLSAHSNLGNVFFPYGTGN